MLNELMSFEETLARQSNWVCGFYNARVMPHARCVKRLEDLLAQVNDESGADVNLVADTHELIKRMWVWVCGKEVFDQSTFSIRIPQRKRK